MVAADPAAPTAVAPTAVTADEQTAIEPWTREVDDALRNAVEEALPGWTLLSGRYDPKRGLQAEVAGHQDVLVTRADATPLRLARHVSLAAGGKPRLVLQLGHDPESQSKLQIRAGGLTLLQLSPPPTAAADQWQEVEVDLSGYAGRDVWITIIQEQAGEAPGYTYWKRLEIIP